jgi:hypothetical protein
MVCGISARTACDGCGAADVPVWYLSCRPSRREVASGEDSDAVGGEGAIPRQDAEVCRERVGDQDAVKRVGMVAWELGGGFEQLSGDVEHAKFAGEDDRQIVRGSQAARLALDRWSSPAWVRSRCPRNRGNSTLTVSARGMALSLVGYGWGSECGVWLGYSAASTFLTASLQSGQAAGSAVTVSARNPGWVSDSTSDTDAPLKRSQ